MCQSQNAACRPHEERAAFPDNHPTLQSDKALQSNNVTYTKPNKYLPMETMRYQETCSYHYVSLQRPCLRRSYVDFSFKGMAMRDLQHIFIGALHDADA